VADLGAGGYSRNHRYPFNKSRIGEPMPYVNVQIIKGATRDQKAQLVKDITDSLVAVLGKKPEHTHIVIQEIDDEDWGFSGLLTDEWKKEQATAGDA
jgi:4-oxalocrotonate tautomerase